MKIVDAPLSVVSAAEQVRSWISAPSAVIVHPGEAHAVCLGQMLDRVGVGGNLVSDAHLAALARHRADLVSYDTDFARFDGVRCHEPETLNG